MKYPDYVKQFRPKGTIVKKSKDTYYCYYATSKRVPEKNYPVQVIKGLAGKIDQYGFHPLTRAVVDTEEVVIRECGFTNFLLLFEDEYVSVPRGKQTMKDKRNIFRSIIVYLSNNSYLCDDPSTILYSPKELADRFHISIVRQVTGIGKLCECELKDLEPLKYICRVRMKNRIFSSTLTSPQKQLLEQLGVSEDDIR